MKDVNFKKIAGIAIAVLTAISLVTGQAAALIAKAVGFFFGAE